MKRDFSKNIDAIYFGFWLIIFLSLQMLHIPWRDEFQPWLIALNTSSVGEFFHAIWYERQAPLQYILLWVAHKIVGSALSPVTVVRAVSDVFTIGVTLLIVFGLRLPRAARYLIPFSIFYFREYGIIARNYPMGVFFLLFAVWAYRKSKPALVSFLLIAAATTHLFFTWIAAILALLFFWERRHEWRKAIQYALPVGLVAVAIVIFLRPPPASPFSAEIKIFALSSLIEVGLTLVRAFTGFGRFFGIHFEYHNWVLIPGVLLVAAYIWSAVKGGVSAWRFCLLCSFPLFVCATTYNPDTRHAGTIFTALLVAWLLNPRPKAYFLTLVSAVSVIATGIWLYAWRPDQSPAHMNHSGARDFLTKYESSIHRGETIVLTDNDKYFFSPMGISGFTIFDIRRNREVKYPYYRDSEYLYQWESWCKNFGKDFYAAHSDKIILLGVTKGTRPSKSCGCMHLDFETPNPAITDEISVYRWDPNAKTCNP